MSYRFGISTIIGNGFGFEKGKEYCEVFVTCDEEDFDDELGISDDNIGHHCPEVQRVLGPIGMDCEDMECIFTKERKLLGKTNKEIKTYIESMGWIYDASLENDGEDC